MNFEQRTSIGLTYVLSKMIPDSPFGSEFINRSLIFHEINQKSLESSYHNIQIALDSFEQHNEAMFEIRKLLSRFKNIRNILNKCNVTFLNEIEFFEIKNFILTLIKLVDQFEFITKNMPFVDIFFVDLVYALDILDPLQKRISPFAIESSQSKELFQIRLEKNEIERQIANSTAIEALDLLKIQRTEIVSREQEEETAIKKDLSSRLREFIPDFFTNFEMIGVLDFTIQKALLAKEFSATRPHITCSKKIYIKNMINPEILVNLNNAGKSVTPVSLEMSSGTTVLTGANMGGKSVAMKTLVLNVYLALSGFFVFADYAELPIFEKIFLISEDMQNISTGLSTFGAEIVRLNQIIVESREKFILVALDELARGTNPQEGAKIVMAVANFFNRSESICILSTHYENISSSSFNNYQVAGLRNVDFSKINFTESTSISDISKHMDYSLINVTGASKTPKDALNICRFLKFDKEVLNEIEN